MRCGSRRCRRRSGQGHGGRGYVQGVEVAQPSVMAFNAHVASAIVVEVMRVVTRFGGT